MIKSPKLGDRLGTADVLSGEEYEGGRSHYEVIAQNSAKDSENRMHDDTVAKSLGFEGGLVPGVDLVAYTSHLAVSRWNVEYLSGGHLYAKFLRPVYEGDLVRISAENFENRQDILATARGEVCVEAFASKTEAGISKNLKTDVIPRPPEEADRPMFDEFSLPEGSVIATRPYAFTKESHQEHLDSVGETIETYAKHQIIHPGSLSRRLNWALTENFRLGPWIHTIAEIQFVEAAYVGDELIALAKVRSNVQKKNRRRITLDGVIIANGRKLISAISHIAYIPTG